MRVRLPHEFDPRFYQLPLFDAYWQGYKRGITVWHRRSGKDLCYINLTAVASQQRTGAYYYYFPTLNEGRKILWDGMDKSGRPFLDAFPDSIVASKNNQEMKIIFNNGSLFQIQGTDKISVVGVNPVGCVFSEYSLQNPQAWNLIRPILAENEGWAYFNCTPRGMNHAYRLFTMAEDNPSWFAQLLTVDDTAAISADAVQEERDSGMSEELVQQEFYCSWEYGLEGAYYLKQLAMARKQNRIGKIPWQPNLDVHTSWDIGVGDDTTIWFFHAIGMEFHFIDYYHNTGYGVDHYAKVLKEKPYAYGRHFAPHDIKGREWGNKGKTKLAAAYDLGIMFEEVPDVGVDNGINEARSVFPACYFDKDNCKDGLDCLYNYTKKYDETKQMFLQRPEHNWASHGADAFRYFAVISEDVGRRLHRGSGRKPKVKRAIGG